MGLNIYKRGQGKYTRTITLVSCLMIALLLARYVWKELSGTDLAPYMVFGIPLAIFVDAAACVFWVVNRPRSADFMIATEGEMKKVSWSSKREIIGGTKVVIATTLILAALLWVVDLAFTFFFHWIGVLPIGTGE